MNYLTFLSNERIYFGNTLPFSFPITVGIIGFRVIPFFLLALGVFGSSTPLLDRLKKKKKNLAAFRDSAAEWKFSRWSVNVPIFDESEAIVCWNESFLILFFHSSLKNHWKIFRHKNKPSLIWISWQFLWDFYLRDEMLCKSFGCASWILLQSSINCFCKLRLFSNFLLAKLSGTFSERAFGIEMSYTLFLNK